MTDPTPRATIIKFFEDLGTPRVSISRETLSRLMRIAYPTLDPVLKGLQSDGILEPHPIMADQWRPTFAFIDKIATADKAERARRLVADIEARERQVAEERERRIIAVEAANRIRATRKAELAAIRAARVERRKAEREAALAATRALTPPTAKPIALMRPLPPRLDPEPQAATAPPAPAPNDPWAIIRARTYGKPPLVASSLRQLTPAELMAGRARKRA